MKKVFAFLLAVLLLASLPMMALATDETLPSPTDVPLVEVTYVSHHEGSATEMFTEIIPLGESISFEAVAAEKYVFLGFSVEGAYDVVSGGEFIFSSATVENAEGATLVLTPKGDVKVTALYTPKETSTEPTEEAAVPAIGATPETNEKTDAPADETDLTWLWIVLAVIVAGAGCAIAAKKLFSKKEQ